MVDVILNSRGYIYAVGVVDAACWHAACLTS
jgi:hypothetical protein